VKRIAPVFIGDGIYYSCTLFAFAEWVILNFSAKGGSAYGGELSSLNVFDSIELLNF
jgi:hypothetical protein